MIGHLKIIWLITLVSLLSINFVNAGKRPQQRIGGSPKRKRKANDDTDNDTADDGPKMELPQRISYETMIKMRNDARLNERIFETKINDNPPWPQHLQMNVSIDFNRQSGVYSYYARIFGTDEWTQIQHSGYIQRNGHSFEVILEVPRYAVGFDCILIGEFHHAGTQKLQYFISDIWQRPSTLSPIYTDEVIRIYENKEKSKLNVGYAKKTNVSLTNPIELEIRLNEPGIYGHYCRRKGEKEWKRSTNVPDRYYEEKAIEIDGIYKLLIVPPKNEHWEYLLIGRADNDKTHLITSKVISTIQGNDGCFDELLIE